MSLVSGVWESEWDERVLDLEPLPLLVRCATRWELLTSHEDIIGIEEFASCGMLPLGPALWETLGFVIFDRDEINCGALVS